MCTTAAGNIVVRTKKEIQVLDRRHTTLTTYNNLCEQHPYDWKWICEMSAGKYLADLCCASGCREIRVIDMATSHVYRAYSPSSCSLYAMCSGPGEGSLLVWEYWSQAVIQLQWNEATKKLDEFRCVEVPAADRIVYNMCYMPHTDLVILKHDNRGEGVLQAVKLQAGAGQPPVWQLKGEVLGKKINPQGVSCDSEGRVYVGDYGNSRVLVVNGNTGEVIQELLQGSGLGYVNRVCCLSNPHQLLVQHRPPSDLEHILSLYNITSL